MFGKKLVSDALLATVKEVTSGEQLDSSGNQLLVGDGVTVQEGPHAGRTGMISGFQNTGRSEVQLDHGPSVAIYNEVLLNEEDVDGTSPRVKSGGLKRTPAEKKAAKERAKRWAKPVKLKPGSKLEGGWVPEEYEIDEAPRRQTDQELRATARRVKYASSGQQEKDTAARSKKREDKERKTYGGKSLDDIAKELKTNNVQKVMQHAKTLRNEYEGVDEATSDQEWRAAARGVKKIGGGEVTGIGPGKRGKLHVGVTNSRGAFDTQVDGHDRTVAKRAANVRKIKRDREGGRVAQLKAKIKSKFKREDVEYEEYEIEEELIFDHLLLDRLLDEAGLDAVDKKALKKKFKDREDQDIDNDGDEDESDEYLHNRRQTIGKKISKRAGKNKNGNGNGEKVEINPEIKEAIRKLIHSTLK